MRSRCVAQQADTGKLEAEAAQSSCHLLARTSQLSLISYRTSATLRHGKSCCAGEGLLSPSQVLVALHSMRTGKDGVPLLAVMTALTICLGQRQTFNRAAIAVALEQLVDRCRRPAHCLI